MSAKDPKNNISTSALAKELGIPSRELFLLLKNLGWMKRHGDTWVLTAKGEFEGGSYANSEKYGRYVVWSQDVLEHRSIKNLPSDMVISASSLGKQFSVSGRYVNHVLAELGWLTPGIKGWRITPAGEALNGEQVEDEETSIPYVKWPLKVIEEPALCCALENSYGQLSSAGANDKGYFQGVDGHHFFTLEEVAICNWLYFAGITHSCGRKLPLEQELYSDFYLPEGNIYIEYWGDKGGSGVLSNKLKRKSIYEDNSWKLIEITKSDIANLDNMIPKELLKHGVIVY